MIILKVRLESQYLVMWTTYLMDQLILKEQLFKITCALTKTNNTASLILNFLELHMQKI